jgi:integrase
MPRKKQVYRSDLLDGCSVTPIAVIPANWDKTGASLKKDWLIWYRFYDPAHKEAFPEGRLCRHKGMNEKTTLGARRAATQQILEDIKYAIFDLGWNPIRKVYMKQAVVDDFDFIIHPDTGLNDALTKALDRIKQKPETEPDMKINLASVLKFFKKASAAAMQANRPVAQIARRHMVMCWDQLAIVKGKAWTDNMHNYYRSYITMLFAELYRIETIEVVPMGSIPVKTVIRKQRETLTMEQRQAIDAGLKKDNYKMWLFMQVFFHSGARTTELLQVKASDVDLVGMRVRYTVKKGRSGTASIIYRPIKEIAVPFWIEALASALPDQYVFSAGLVPGSKSIRREQITRRWRTWVKKKYEKYGITADFYSLKHSNTAEVVDEAGNTAAARLTGHKSTKMIDEVYDVKKADRESEKVRGVKNKFA